MPTVDIYSKGQTDTLLSAKANTTDLPSSAQLVPSTSGATAGDVLTFDGSSVGWAAGAGGGGWTDHTFESWTDLVNFVYSNLNSIKTVIFNGAFVGTTVQGLTGAVQVTGSSSSAFSFRLNFSMEAHFSSGSPSVSNYTGYILSAYFSKNLSTGTVSNPKLQTMTTDTVSVSGDYCVRVRTASDSTNLPSVGSFHIYT